MQALKGDILFSGVHVKNSSVSSLVPKDKPVLRQHYSNFLSSFA